MATNPQESFQKFLEELDEYFLQNWKHLTGADIYHFYDAVFKILKEVKGNSNGFTGLSELLIWKIVWHQLGGKFKRVPLANDMLKFQSLDDPRICIGQSIEVSVKGKRRYPDISIYYSDKLTAVVSIKLYLTNGSKTLYDELSKFKELKEGYPDNDIRILLIIYGLSAKGKTQKELDKIESENDWFKYLILNNKQSIMSEKLREYLGLDRIGIV